MLLFLPFEYASAKLLQSCLTPCDPMDCRPSGSSIHGISQTRILEWVAIPSSGDLPDPGIELSSIALAGGFFNTEPPEKANNVGGPHQIS